MKKWGLLLLFLVLMLIAARGYACGNEYYSASRMPMHNDTLVLNYLLYGSNEFERPYWWNGFENNIVVKKDSLYKVMFDKAGLYPESIYAKYAAVIQKLLVAGEFRLLSDYAWYELRRGYKDSAVSLLEELYRRYPNEYNIVANLGTAYEVTGNNTKALELLRKAVQINARSHYNSEWIHIKILEQQIAAQPDYSRIVDLGIINFAQWINDKTYQFPQPPDSLKKQIAYQLHERISFIAPPDPVIAQLVLDFADIVAKHDGVTAAIPFYDYAAVYGNENITATVIKRKKTIAKVKEEIETTLKRAAIIWAVPLLAFVLIFVAWLRSRRKNRES